MRADLPATLPLICPRCKVVSERGIELHTVSLAATFRDDDGGAEIVEGALACDNPGCRRRYPIVDGIPLLVMDVAAYLRSEIASVVEGDLRAETYALLAAAGPDGEPYPRLHEHLSIYLDAHWGDRADPPPDGPGPTPFGMADVAARLRARRAAPVARAVELGCSVGRGLAEIAPAAGFTLGIDLHFGALRRARRLLRGEPVRFPRRSAGRHARAATITPGDLAAREVALVCGDALDPPLAPGGWDRVVALNLLDSVRDPRLLLAVADKLCAAGGELLLASPFSWQSGIVDEEARLGEHDPAAALAAELQGEHLSARYTVEEEADLGWWLRRDARSGHLYSVYFVRARKT